MKKMLLLAVSVCLVSSISAVESKYFSLNKEVDNFVTYIQDHKYLSKSATENLISFLKKAEKDPSLLGQGGQLLAADLPSEEARIFMVEGVSEIFSKNFMFSIAQKIKMEDEVATLLEQEANLLAEGEKASEQEIAKLSEQVQVFQGKVQQALPQQEAEKLFKDSITTVCQTLVKRLEKISFK